MPWEAISCWLSLRILGRLTGTLGLRVLTRLDPPGLLLFFLTERAYSLYTSLLTCLTSEGLDSVTLLLEGNRLLAPLGDCTWLPASPFPGLIECVLRVKALTLSLELGCMTVFSNCCSWVTSRSSCYWWRDSL